MSVPVLQFVPAQPANLLEVLESQARCLIANQVPKEVGVDEAKFLDDAMTLSQQFTYSVELAAIGLNKVWIVHYGVRDRYLAEVGGVKIWSDPDKFTPFEGVTAPEGLCIVQGQLGSKYKGRSPRDVRQSHDSLEKLGVPKEGLTPLLYWGKPLLEECRMDFPGVVSEDGDVPCLVLSGGEPVLFASFGVSVDSRYGSVSVSRGS